MKIASKLHKISTSLNDSGNLVEDTGFDLLPDSNRMTSLHDRKYF